MHKNCDLLVIHRSILVYSSYCGILDQKMVFCSKLLQTSSILSPLHQKIPASRLVHSLRISSALQHLQVIFIFQNQFEKCSCGKSSINVVVTVNLTVY
jgi:hypothetical protein